jgi:hypothetical protein
MARIEKAKPETERGFYLHPELFGTSAKKSIAAGEGGGWTVETAILRRRDSQSLQIGDTVMTNALATQAFS